MDLLEEIASEQYKLKPKYLLMREDMYAKLFEIDDIDNFFLASKNTKVPVGCKGKLLGMDVYVLDLDVPYVMTDTHMEEKQINAED